VHVCKQCEFYDSGVADACKEDRAETVSDKEKANFCDYFKVIADAYKGAQNKQSEQARKQAEALFSGMDSEAEIDSPETESEDPAQAAREELKRLFGNSD
jgi:hypothetical protein